MLISASNGAEIPVKNLADKGRFARTIRVSTIYIYKFSSRNSQLINVDNTVFYLAGFDISGHCNA